MDKALTNTAMTHLQGELEVSYGELVKAFGEPNADFDDYKSSCEWHIQTPYGVATIYDYKTCKAYCGEDLGVEPSKNMYWHIGGHNKETFDYIKNF